MDVSEVENDVVVQQSSAGLIADFDRSLGPFLRKPNGELRARVRVREVSRLISQVLDPFQELPQLLDSQLPKWLPVLSEAYLACLQNRQRSRSQSARSQWLLPLQDSICRVLYTFCKIRGEKVIVRFLNVETRYLELLLRALEDADRHTSTSADSAEAESQNTDSLAWTWYERYVVLLWLSQLFFAPFDLSTISSGDADDSDRPVVPGFTWPQNVPGITLRVIPLAMKYLSSPGKERDGAKAILVRLAMRKDMQEAGILNALVQWSLQTLRPVQDEESKSPYHYIGSLSFIAGVLRSASDTSIMDTHLPQIFDTIEAIAFGDDSHSETIKGSALARKMMIKIVRSVATLVLRKPDQTMIESQMIETSIGYLLERLADNDTPVRLSASKALSVIALKLEADMATQVVSAVLEALNRNVLWIPAKTTPGAPPIRDLTAVDPLEWHGLMLTLAHLLYRRSPPADDLSDIIHALLMGLTFDKRSSSGSLIGSNVRDAACFGIWALARRYSTSELLLVQKNSVQIARGHDASVSILQVIATELVVTASLDPAGNIRRGSSAALQELIGRHPDTVEYGIAVVQTVDYHAVALRSRAIHTVALQATRLSLHYGRTILDATLGWRGIGDVDAEARRVSAKSFGNLTAELAKNDPSPGMEVFQKSIELLANHINSLQVRQVEERHGLILSLASVLDALLIYARELFDKNTKPLKHSRGEFLDPVRVDYLLSTLEEIWVNSATVKYRKPELVIEAASQLLVSAGPLLGVLTRPAGQMPGQLRVRPFGPEDQARGVGESRLQELASRLEPTIEMWLEKNSDEVIEPASAAAQYLLAFSDQIQRIHIVAGWCEKIKRLQSQQNTYHDGYFNALTRAHSISGDVFDICEVLTTRWASEKSIELRVAILRSVQDKKILKQKADGFLGIISEGLDDYYTNTRGDVGSYVRMEAIKAVRTIWDTKKEFSPEFMTAVFPRMLRLAAEKLDRVRFEAQRVLALILPTDQVTRFANLSFASEEYFQQLFKLCNTNQLDIYASPGWTMDRAGTTASLLAGLVTSADTGNEDLVVVTRAALMRFCETSNATPSSSSNISNLSLVIGALVGNLKRHIAENNDRVVLPTLEVIGFLFHVGILPGSTPAHPSQTPATGTPSGILNLRQLCLLVQKAAYKTGSVRKLEACVRIYGEIARLDIETATGESALLIQQQKRTEGIVEAKKRLGALLSHPWPRIRSLVVDETYVSLLLQGQSADIDVNNTQEKQQYLMGVDWSKADKNKVRDLVRAMDLEQPVAAA